MNMKPIILDNEYIEWTPQTHVEVLHRANMYPRLVEFVKTLENDGDMLPAWLWKWRNGLLAECGES